MFFIQFFKFFGFPQMSRKTSSKNLILKPNIFQIQHFCHVWFSLQLYPKKSNILGSIILMFDKLWRREREIWWFPRTFSNLFDAIIWRSRSTKENPGFKDLMKVLIFGPSLIVIIPGLLPQYAYFIKFYICKSIFEIDTQN